VDLLGHDAAQEGELIASRIDRKPGGQTDLRAVLAEDPGAQGVEGRQGDAPGLLARLGGNPFAHLVGSPVREGDREDTPGVDPRLEQMDDPVDERARLPGTGPRQDEHRAFGRHYGGALRRVQPLEVSRMRTREVIGHQAWERI
jgi:hypothetical protein